MKPVCVALLGTLLLLHLLSSQVVQAQNQDPPGAADTTPSPINVSSVRPNGTVNENKNGCGRMDALTPLLLLTLCASLLHGWLH